MVSGGMKVIKYLLFFFNLIFWVTGAAILGLGIFIQVKYNHFFEFVGTKFLSVPILLIVVGCIIVIIAFFGCCGAIKESHCMMITFSVLLAIIFILELAAGIAAYVMRKDLDETIRDNMLKTMEEYEKPEHKAITKSWDAMQHDLKCCGTNNASDWNKHAHINTTVPESCCEKKGPDCTQNKADWFKDACYPKLAKSAGDNIVIVGGVGVGIAFIQIIGIVCACCLASAIKREYEVV